MNIAIIPARFGSKRVRQKNIKLFNGKPMLAWAIQVAIKSGCFDKVLVSTDREEIAEIAKTFGADVPFIRPVHLSDDHTSTQAVIAHAIKECLELGWVVDNVCCIYACAPFILVQDLVSALNVLNVNPGKFVYPVCQFSHPIQRAMSRDELGNMSYLQEKYELSRTQDLEKSFYDAGQFYWGSASEWLGDKKLHSNGIGMQVPNWRYVDIDSEDDWTRAEIFFLVLEKFTQDMMHEK